MDRELLDGAVDRRREVLQLGALLGLDQVLLEPGRLRLGLGELVEHGCADIRPWPARASRPTPPPPPRPRCSRLFWTASSFCCSISCLQHRRDRRASSPAPCLYSVLRMSNRSWTTGMVASSLSIVAAIVARSASFCSCLALERAELGPVLAAWLSRKLRCVLDQLGRRSAGGLKPATADRPLLDQRRAQRATSSWAARGRCCR